MLNLKIRNIIYSLLIHFILVIFFLILSRSSITCCEGINALCLDKEYINIMTSQNTENLNFYKNNTRELFYADINAQTISLLKIVKNCNLSELQLIDYHLKIQEQHANNIYIYYTQDTSENTIKDNNNISNNSKLESLTLFIGLSLGIYFLSAVIPYLFCFFSENDLILDYRKNIFSRILILEDKSWFHLQELFNNIRDTSLPDKYFLR